MTRSNPDDAVLFFNPDTTTNESLNAADFDFGWQPGVELGIIKHRLFWDTDLEMRMWGIDGWTSGASTSISGPNTAIATNPVSQGVGARDITSTYASRLASLEFNLRRRSTLVPRWRWIAGFRMVELDEHLDSVFVDPNGFNGNVGNNVATRNRLYGLQLGGELNLISGCKWCVRGFFKGGMYGNEANNSSNLQCIDNNACAGWTVDQNKSRASFLGETGIAVKYCLCEDLAVRADYRAVWVSGVALASEQINATDPVSRVGASTSGDVFYHGGFLGLEYSF